MIKLRNASDKLYKVYTEKTHSKQELAEKNLPVKIHYQFATKPEFGQYNQRSMVEMKKQQQFMLTGKMPVDPKEAAEAAKAAGNPMSKKIMMGLIAMTFLYRTAGPYIKPMIEKLKKEMEGHM